MMSERRTSGGLTNTTDTECPDDEGDLDPRIQEELNILNQASVDINKLENELDEARCNYKITFTEASQRLAQAAEKRRKQIQRARAYFELKEEAKRAQGESLKAARQYQSAISVYRAAKETVTLAEERLLQNGEGNISAAWQEMMNHATMRVMDAEKEKRESEERHQLVTTKCANCEKKLKQLEKKFSKSIQKAGPYFEVKQQLDIKLQHQKQNVTDLQSAIKDTKAKYSNALRNLEKISEEIHQSRRDKIMLMFPRQPGVGAESGSSLASMVPDFSLEELESVSEISDSAIEDDEPVVKDDGIYINCAFVSNGNDDKNGSDAILDTKSSKKHETEKLSQTFYEYTENSEQERDCMDNLSQGTSRTDDFALNVEEKWELGCTNTVSLGNTDSSTPESQDIPVLGNSDKLARGYTDRLVKKYMNEEVKDQEVKENSQGLLPENTDEPVLKNVENLTLKNIDESVNNIDEKANRNTTEHIES